VSTQNLRQISTKTHKILWGLAASRCAFPECRRELVMNSSAVDDVSLVGQECHIIAKEPDGPRGNAPLSSKQRDEYDNLLLLCNIHHKLIDDQSNTYTVERLRQIKVAHEQWVRESLQGTSPIWNVPHSRNPLFTGREDVLDLLHDRLIATKSTALIQPQAISGLGGIGKTQIVLEYAYTYREKYHVVLWMRANTYETLTLDYVNTANKLHLPLQDEQDQNLIIEAVKEWLATHTHWLLVIDNANDLTSVSRFLPTHYIGHILLTTRNHSTGKIAQGIEVETMNQEEATLLLLRCSKVLEPEEPLTQATDEKRQEAEALVKELGSLPLALDQAGAYIEETDSTLSEYRTLYQTHRKVLLSERGERTEDDHPEPVTITWSLSFIQIERTNSIAADALRLCAFLDADAIPEDLFTQNISSMPSTLSVLVGNTYLLKKIMKDLLRFSLIRHNTETKQISIHRLVQAVIKDEMSIQNYRLWAERTIRIIYEAFPSVDVSTWEKCRKYLPHAQACLLLMEQENYTFPEAIVLLVDVARYNYDHALYSEAEPLYKRALAICEQVLGFQHPDTASSLNNLATLYSAQGKYEQMEPLLQHALAIREQVLDSQHPDTASSLNNLAALYNAQGKYEQMEPLLQHALAIYEKQVGPFHLHTANCLNNLALLYKTQSKYEQAESLYQRALSIYGQYIGSSHLCTANSLNNLASLYEIQGKYEQAESLYHKALYIREQELVPTHPDIANSLNNIGLFYKNQGKYEQAEPLYHKALSICEEQLGPAHPYTADCLNNLAGLYRVQGKYEQAEPLSKHALAICEQMLGPQHPNTIVMRNNYVSLQEERKKHS